MPAPKDPEKYEQWIKNLSESHKGEKNHNFGKPRSEETRKKIAKSNTGKPGYWKGKTRDEKTRSKISASLEGDKSPNFGKPPSESTRKKISESHKGEKCYWFGKHHSEETKQKKSQSMMGKRVGDKNPVWKGGVSFEPYCPKFNREFKERVREFFGYTCVECETTQEKNGRKLDVHHVNYDKMVCCNDVKPLFVALCRSCNVKANANRPEWEKHYTEMIMTKYGGQCYLPKEAQTDEQILIGG